jgi:hypothetical protein
MSAWIVSDKHIASILVTAHRLLGAEFWRVLRFHLKVDNEEAAAAILLRENYRSVNYRYKERKRAPKVVSFAEAEAVNLAQFKTLLDCYAYQSCEHKGWERSGSRSLILDLKERLLDYVVKLHYPDQVANAQWSF